MDLIKKIFPIDENGKFNIFGFSIYCDDLLILAILFLLYREKVSNKLLYIVLIMLLL